MKIVFYSSSLYLMILFRGKTIEYLANKGHELFIIAHHDVDPMDIEYQHDNISYLNIDIDRSLNVRKEWRALWAYKKMLKHICPDFVFSYSLKSCLLSMAASWQSKNIYFITGMGSSLLNKKYRMIVSFYMRTFNIFQRLFAKYTDQYVFLNKDDQQFFVDNSLCRLQQANVFPGEGVDCQYFVKRPLLDKQQPISFLFIGRLIKDKGVQELMAACKRMCEQHIPFKCTMIAPADKHNPTGLSALTSADFSEAGIEYIPFAKDVRPYIAEHDVIVLPSYSEGLSRVLLESMAIGRPIITTDVPGCRELINQQDCGMLVPAKDVEALFAAMYSMSIKSRNELAMLGDCANAKIINHYAMPHVIKHYQTLITDPS